MTNRGLDLLLGAVARWLEGAEDFSVCPRHSDLKSKDLGPLDHSSVELWFWGPGYAGP
jgi:hypothetical protein